MQGAAELGWTRTWNFAGQMSTMTNLIAGKTPIIQLLT